MSAFIAAMINGGIAGAAVTLAVWLLMSAVPRRALNAATRYAVWWITLLVVVTLPLLYLPHQTEPIVSYQPLPAPAEQTVVAQQTESRPVAEITSAPSQWPQFPLEFSAGQWPSWIFTAWSIAAGLMMLRLCASYFVLERRKRRARPVDDLENSTVRVLISPDVASPMAAGLFRPAILFPERLFAELEPEELEQIRVHETAHLLRRDDVALLVERIIEAIFALHPVVRWITRQIDLEREIACDDFVLEQTGQARPYASCLTRVVEIAGGVRTSIVAPAATEQRSHLARRIEMLLDKTRHRGTRLLKARLAFMAAALIALAFVVQKTPGLIAFAAEEQDAFMGRDPLPPAAPAPAAAAAAPTPAVPPTPAAPQSTWSEHNNSTVTWRTSDGLHKREMRLHGAVHFNDDETDVKTMSADGFFSYEESYGFSSRRYQAMGNSSGQIVRRYLVDGSEKPFDADAQAWLRAALPDILRDSGIDAPERVRRLLKQGGAPAVLAEVSKIHSDGTKALYIRELVPIGNLNRDQFQSVLRELRSMNSDGDKASLLEFLASYTLKDSLRDYAFEAVKTIHSDGDKRRVLTRFILTDGSRGTLTLTARSAADINSDGDKAAVLVDLATHLRGNSDLSHPFFRTAESIHSDGDRARVLMAAMASAGEQRDTLVEAIRAAHSISSDGDKASVLVHAGGYWKDDDLLRSAFFETAGSLHSDGDKARVLTSLVGRSGLSDRTLIDAAHCSTTINSDGDKARVLIEIANHANGKTEVREAVKTAAGTIHSDGDYRRVMAAIDLRASNRP